jgi:hypothetical protein
MATVQMMMEDTQVMPAVALLPTATALMQQPFAPPKPARAALAMTGESRHL